jgi:hypothetical protein
MFDDVFVAGRKYTHWLNGLLSCNNDIFILEMGLALLENKLLAKGLMNPDWSNAPTLNGK